MKKDGYLDDCGGLKPLPILKEVKKTVKKKTETKNTAKKTVKKK